MRYLQIEEEFLIQRGARWTAREISQQPGSWERTQELLNERERAINAFVQPLLARTNLRIVLTGAGSSAYIGQGIAPALLRALDRRVEAIANTDIVSRPTEYLQKDVPTLLVSFGRSGNSPESLAAVELVSEHVNEAFHLVLTCNADGELHRSCAGRKDSLVVLLPEETHDNSFAMTSSFSSMLYAALTIFLGIRERAKMLPRIAAAGAAVIEGFNTSLRTMAEGDHERVVYLGSGGFTGLANEAALKLLELTDGRIPAIAQSSLGFRHGPKSFLNSSTLVVVLLSNDSLTRRYDLDLLREIRNEGVAADVLAITAKADDDALGGQHILVPGLNDADDMDLALPFIVCAQLYAFHRSLRVGNSPDNPSKSGTVNRVVRGVTIHTH